MDQKTSEKEERPSEEKTLSKMEKSQSGKGGDGQNPVWIERIRPNILEKGVKEANGFVRGQGKIKREPESVMEKVRSNGYRGVDRQSIEAYEKETKKNLVELEKILREGATGQTRQEGVDTEDRKPREEPIRNPRGHRSNCANGDEERNRADI
ncbi:MAG: hypothetical protein HS132_19130 [Planctomycetia bacterium]|nr:hypothetical protein [Planctomycetia bacterium]